MTNENNKSDFELQMEQLYMWKLLEEKCRKNVGKMEIEERQL